MKKMKKALLGLAFIATLMTSCKKETKDEVKEATEAVGNEMEDAIDTAAVKVDAAADSTKAKAGEVLEKGADKMNQAAEKLKEAAKK
jgi:PBP1b-binding outer membrane lipoprotein LpoB